MALHQERSREAEVTARAADIVLDQTVAVPCTLQQWRRAVCVCVARAAAVKTRPSQLDISYIFTYNNQ